MSENAGWAVIVNLVIVGVFCFLQTMTNSRMMARLDAIEEILEKGQEEHDH